MARNKWQRVTLVPNQGINQNVEFASPSECADALNVWAPNGIIEQRPGYWAVSPTYNQLANDTNATGQAYYHDVGGAGSITTIAQSSTIPSAATQEGDIWYFQFTDAEYTSMTTYGPGVVTISNLATNISDPDPYIRLQYYDGSNWVDIPYVLLEGSTNDGSDPPNLVKINFLWHDTASNTNDAWHILFVPPQDWTKTTPGGDASSSAYYIRLVIDGDNVSTALTTGASFTTGTNVYVSGAGGNDQRQAFHKGLFLCRFTGENRYIRVVSNFLQDANSYGAITNSSSLTYNDAIDHTSTISGVSLPETYDHLAPDQGTLLPPATVAIVPDQSQAFVAFNNLITKHTASDTKSVEVYATTTDSAILSGSPFDGDFIAQDSGFPQTNLITYFKGHLWVAVGSNIKWSAPNPYHETWPSISEEPVSSGNDASEITAMHSLGEHLVVFKRDSIWLMVPAGEAFGTISYTPTPVVFGVGCLSHHSVVEVRGTLVFLAEDGVYQFNGQSVRKVSEKQVQVSQTQFATIDRLRDFWPKITPNRRLHAYGVNWRTKGCYLLALATEGSQVNDKVLVWDYVKDSLWIWNNIEAQVWLLDDTQDNEERLFFGDSKGGVFEVGVENTDYGAAISSNILTQRVPTSNSDVDLRLREVKVVTKNTAGSFTIAAYANDDADNATSASSISPIDVVEDVYDTGLYGTDTWVAIKRREKSAGFRVQGDWIQVKVSHSAENQPFYISAVNMGFLPVGVR